MVRRKSILSLFFDIKESGESTDDLDLEAINKDHGNKGSVRAREKLLAGILSFCIKTVPYYEKLSIKKTKLADFPVVDKNLIRENSESMRSRRLLNEKNFKVTTSGSTGTPFTVLQNKGKKERNRADVKYFAGLAGHNIGTRLYYMKIWNEENTPDPQILKQLNYVPVSVFQLGDDKITELIEEFKNDAEPKSILAYASALDVLAKYLDKNLDQSLEVNMTSIIAMSETLSTPTKDILKQYFKCPVVSRYSNMENGILAQQTPFSKDNFIINLASYKIEILDITSDIPLENGKMGRIIVTDLFNKAMPMIRYDTGDLGILEDFHHDGVVHSVLKVVEGRKMDAIYDSSGHLVSSFIITNSMWKYAELAQYQFIQNSGNTYTFKLNVDGDFKREDELITEFMGYLGEDATIKIDYVKEIPLLSSGKRKKVINKKGQRGIEKMEE